MTDIQNRLKAIYDFVKKKQGAPLRLLYIVDGQEQVGTVDNMIAAGGTFIRCLGGNSLNDLDRLLQFEFDHIKEVGL